MGTGKAIRKSNLSDCVSDGFITNHMGNFKDAEKIAERRARQINASASHTISIDELGAIKSEIRERLKNGAFVDDNRVRNPANGNRQFVTEKKYRIFETRYKSRSIGKTKEKNFRFYFDIRDNKLHHFDGVK